MCFVYVELRKGLYIVRCVLILFELYVVNVLFMKYTFLIGRNFVGRNMIGIDRFVGCEVF